MAKNTFLKGCNLTRMALGHRLVFLRRQCSCCSNSNIPWLQQDGQGAHTMMAGENVVRKMLPQCIIPLNNDHVHLIHLHMITICGNSLRMKCTPLGLEKSTTSSKEYSKQSQ